MNAKEHFEYPAGQYYDLEDLLGSRNVRIWDVAIRVEDGEAFANDSFDLSQLGGHHGWVRTNAGIARDLNTILIHASIVFSSVVSRVVSVAQRSQLPEQAPVNRSRVDRDFKCIETLGSKIDQNVFHLTA